MRSPSRASKPICFSALTTTWEPCCATWPPTALRNSNWRMDELATSKMGMSTDRSFTMMAVIVVCRPQIVSQWPLERLRHGVERQRPVAQPNEPGFHTEPREITVHAYG